MSSPRIADRGGGWRALLGLAAASFAATGQADAQPLGDPPRPCVARTGDASEVAAVPVPSLVDLTLAGNGQMPALAAVIGQLLGRLQVTVCAARAGSVDPADVLRPPADPAPALARIWIVPTGEGATVYVVDAGWNRILVRHVPLPGGLEVAAREELAQIVYSTVEALQAGAEIGVTRPAAEVPPVATAPRAGVNAELQLRGTGRLSGRTAIGREVTLAVAFTARRSRPALVAGIALGYRLATTETTDWVDIRSSGAQLRFEVGLEVARWGATSLRPGVGLGLELEFVDPNAVAGSGVVPEPAEVALWPLASAHVALHHRLSGPLSVAGAITADVDILGARYAVEEHGDSTVVAEPWVLRPGVWLGLVSRL